MKGLDQYFLKLILVLTSVAKEKCRVVLKSELLQGPVLRHTT